MIDLVSDSAAYKMFLQAWWPDLTATDVLRRLGTPRIVARIGDGILNGAEQVALAASYAGEGWSVADTALLDELVSMLGPIEDDLDADPLLFLGEETRTTEVITTADWLRDVREVDPDAEPHDTFAHVLVDEAQDISPMQWRMLRRRGSQASWTIVGDPAQSSWPDLEESAKAQQELIGSAPHAPSSGSPPTTAAPLRCSSSPPRSSVAPTRRRTCPTPSARPEWSLCCWWPPRSGSPQSWMGQVAALAVRVPGHDWHHRRPVPAGSTRGNGVGHDRGQCRARRVPEPAQCQGSGVRRGDRGGPGRDRRRVARWCARSLRRAHAADAATRDPRRGQGRYLAGRPTR